MLSVNDLKKWLHLDLSRQDKLLLVLASLSSPSQVRDIRNRASEAGFQVPNSWNPSDSLGKSRGMAVRTPEGWEITDLGNQRLRSLGVAGLTHAAVQIAIDLRIELAKIEDEQTRAFVEEAINCYEAQFYRSAVVMSWVGAVAVLHRVVCSMYLEEFNLEVKKVNSKWRDARTTDELSEIRDAEFLERIASISVIGHNVKKELKKCLDLRNSCSHPNSLRISNHTVAHHLEILLLNVFVSFREVP